MKDVTPLTDNWTLRHVPDGGPVPEAPAGEVAARVPGCVHTDLLDAGLIEDPFLALNETAVAWIGRTGWRYDTELGARATAHERTDLVLDGLDTVAAVRVGGETVGNTRNMHRSYRFDVTDLLDPAVPTPLTVEFTSAYTEAEAVRALLGERPNAYPEPFPYIRKMACSFGWDWGPTLVTAGIWKPVRLEHWSTARLARVRPLVTVDGSTGRAELRVDIERTGTGNATGGGTDGGPRLTLRARVGDHTASADTDGSRAALTVEVPGAALWWPRGYGEQPLYEAELELLDADGALLDRWRRRLGFRTVTLDTSADAHGTAFTLGINGQPVFARGVNWIPDDAFPSRVGPDRYRARLTQAADAGVNLVRVWGGGLYESDDFYDVCDELGLTVWQDFPFACAAYPEEQPLRSEIEAEARENVTRLMPHPSLVLWNGNNENLWGFRDWDWEPALDGDSWGEGYYLGLLPRVVAETDPTRPYWAGSPWSGSWDHHPNDPAHGTAHSWDVWNRADHTDYLDTVPRFVAEFGWQAPPAHATLRRALPGEELSAGSPGMLHHQKAHDGNGKLDRGLARHFTPPEPGPAGFDRWHYLTQLNQARAVTTGIAHWRSHWPVCAGTVLWQLNDCWPVTSWAAVDGDGRPKPLYFALRRLYADRLLTVQIRDGRPTVVADNQSPDPWDARVRLRRTAADGRTLAETTVTVRAGARAVACAAVPAALLPDPASAKEFLVADAGDLRATYFPVRDHEFAYPPPRYDVAAVRRSGGRTDIVVTARTLLRDLLLQADRLAPTAVADQGPLTLLPGESATIGVHGWDREDPPSTAAVRDALFVVEPA
ncbi:glycoside hydrolase family 2 protein [Streptomyces sp. NBC_01498]|uniref:glycoside hydrolase family 2 protein n=1 Tax=Streptomyces sp. NBC_01498 TaxID=2975870 RepID=UPI002E7BAE73|nr:glycoside hydrolase family 2 protein [Streptomyces sp. NBC_01498]WTL24157.1 glycoside hydrolase family 2 protein [Streptomyces sp. NBC_01498]